MGLGHTPNVNPLKTRQTNPATAMYGAKGDRPDDQEGLEEKRKPCQHGSCT